LHAKCGTKLLIVHIPKLERWGNVLPAFYCGLKYTKWFHISHAGPGGIPLSPRYNTDSPEIVEKAFGDGPELTSRNVHRSFSFSFSSAPDPTHHSPDLQEGRLSNARKDKRSVSISETPISAPARSRRQKKPPPSPDGLLSTPYSRKKPEGLSEENKNKSVDIFRPYVRFLTEMYDEAAYRALMKPPLGGLMSIVSRDHLKYQMNSDSSLT